MSDTKRISLRSGSSLIFKYCKFSDFLELKNVVLSSLNIKFDSDFLSRKISNTDILQLIEPIVKMLGTRELDEALLKCASVCALNDERISRDLFEVLENRKDYLEVMYYVLLENFRVFTAGLEGILLDISSPEKSKSENRK
jgi:hypothetical protein